jgi:hypothetical protein
MALVHWLGTHDTAPRVSSCLAEIEVARTLRRHDRANLPGLPSELAHVYRVDIDPRVRAVAAAHEDSLLRPLDAMHLASADVLMEDGQPLDAFVAYDDRLLAAAERRGWTVARPGPVWY